MSQKLRFDDHNRQETRYTTCYMCACRCGIQVTLEDGKLRFIQGNRNHPVNQGVICAKGSAGIMKQNSAAKLRHPMLRRPGSERGAGEFVPISWEDALELLTARLAKIRSTDPKKLAFFTGRDQMQGLTGLWAQQFGTLNWAAHGGFCSVNMAAAGLYSIGYSFWEFGAPDWDRAKYFMLCGVAEDHSSNPIKIGLGKLKERGAKFVSINPVRTGYSAIADEWVPVRPGTDGLLALAMVHVLLSRELVDWEFLVRYTNAPWLVVQAPGTSGDGLFARDAEGQPLVWDQQSERFANGLTPEIAPALFGEFTTPDGRRAKTVLSLVAERYLDPRYSPENVAVECGVPAETIERLALEMAHVAFKETIELPIEWTDVYGRKHDKVIGCPADGRTVLPYVVVAVVLLLISAVTKGMYYKRFRVPGKGYRIERAIGATAASVKLLDAGHSHGTFLTREFVFVLARDRSRAPRYLFVLTSFAVPLVAFVPYTAGMLTTSAWLWGGVALLALVGLLVERWLFFAEAQHVVRLYHGQQAV